jgi:hypothetical protein
VIDPVLTCHGSDRRTTTHGAHHRGPPRFNVFCWPWILIPCVVRFIEKPTIFFPSGGGDVVALQVVGTL